MCILLIAILIIGAFAWWRLLLQRKWNFKNLLKEAETLRHWALLQWWNFDFLFRRSQRPSLIIIIFYLFILFFFYNKRDRGKVSYFILFLYFFTIKIMHKKWIINFHFSFQFRLYNTIACNKMQDQRWLSIYEYCKS